jgi:hypothetical protein
MNFKDFKILMENEIELVQFLLEKNILKIPICGVCDVPMTPTKNIITYKCYKRRNSKKCSNEGSVLRKSIFYNTKLSLKDCLLILLEWCKSGSNFGACMEADVVPSTVTRWYQKLNDLVFEKISESIFDDQIGGPGLVVEIDETLLVKNKYYRGRILQNQVWAIGAVVRGQANTFFVEIVEDRSRNTIVGLIRRKIAPQSVIVTDSWRGYLNIENICSDLGYSHFKVNHSENFIDPQTGQNTQTIEGMWSVIKRQLRKEGSNHGDLVNILKKVYMGRFKITNRENILETLFGFLAINE